MATNMNFLAQETREAQKNTRASIKNLETQVGQIAQQLTQRAPRTLPSNTVINPWDHENVNMVTTRSRKREESLSSQGDSSPELIEVEVEVRDAIDTQVVEEPEKKKKDELPTNQAAFPSKVEERKR
jgi:hypothetical protein